MPPKKALKRKSSVNEGTLLTPRTQAQLLITPQKSSEQRPQLLLPPLLPPQHQCSQTLSKLSKDSMMPSAVSCPRNPHHLSQDSDRSQSTRTRTTRSICWSTAAVGNYAATLPSWLACPRVSPSRGWLRTATTTAPLCSRLPTSRPSSARTEAGTVCHA